MLEFTYGQKLKSQFQGSIANLQTFGQTWGFEPSASSVTFVDNHDTDRNGSTLNYKDGSTYQLANIFPLAWGYGTPQVYASFTFGNTSTNRRPPTPTASSPTPTAATAWYCTDRVQGVAHGRLAQRGRRQRGGQLVERRQQR